MDPSHRALSSSSLMTCTKSSILSPPLACQPPLRARSTVNLSSTPYSPRNRALSWSPVRFDAPAKVSSLPWARKGPGEDPSKRKSSIDGSVAKAKMVWEQVTSAAKNTPVSTPQEEPNAKAGPKKGSVSFRHPKAPSAVAPAIIQKSSTSDDLIRGPIGDRSLDPSSPKLRAKDQLANGTPSERTARRKGFVGADLEESSQDFLDAEDVLPTADPPVAETNCGATDSIQSSGGRSHRRGGGTGLGVMEGREAHPFVSNPSTISSSNDSTRPASNLSSNSSNYHQQLVQHQQQNVTTSQYRPPPLTSQTYQYPQMTNVPPSQHNCPIQPNNREPLSSRKAQSLPGYYVKQNPHLVPQTSFREAFANSRSPTPTRRHDSAAPTSPLSSRRSKASQSSYSTPSPHQTPRQFEALQQQRVAQAHQFHGNVSQPLPLEQPFHSTNSTHNIRPQQPPPAAHSTPIHRSQRPQQPLPVSAAQSQQQSLQKPLNNGLSGQPSHAKDQQDVGQDKKTKRSLLGLFKRRKKTDANALSSSGDETHSAKNASKTKPKKTTDISQPFANLPQQKNRTNFTVSADGKTVVRVAPERNFERESPAVGQPLGIPLLIPPPGELLKRGVSASHDSIMPTAFSKAFLSPHHHGDTGSMGNRCSSIDNVARRERRLALKNRVENLRTKYKDSSSEEDQKSLSSQSMYDSGGSLNRMGSLTKRSRAARTERYLRRKSHELETLKQETQRDKRSKEAVQARIQEIQRVQQYEAERNRLNQETISNQGQESESNKPRWSANLVYQESSEFDSVILQTPPATPDTGRRPQSSSAKQDSSQQNLTLMKHSKSVHFKNRAPGSSNTNSVGVTIGGEYCSNTSLNKPIASDVLSMGDLKSHRSVSYDCNINKAFMLPGTFDRAMKSRATPPQPPPRDMTRIVSPAEHRPFSYSFENINQVSPAGSQTHLLGGSKCTTASQGIRALLSHNRQNGSRSTLQQFPTSKRAVSEVQLPQAKNLGRPTALPPLPTSVHSASPQVNEIADQEVSSLSVHTAEYARVNPVTNIPPSPSSDYSSYVSDSARLNQVNEAWKQKEQTLKNNKSSGVPHLNEGIISDSSRSSTPKTDRSAHSLLFNESGSYGRKPKPITLKADSVSSLSCHSEISSPVVKSAYDKRPDSDMSVNEIQHKKNASSDNQKPGFPEPPKRSSKQGNLSSLEKAKKEMQMIIQQERDLQQTKAEKHKQFEEAYLRERKKLERARCANFEEALHELEEIYRSLKWDNDDQLGECQDTDKALESSSSWTGQPASGEGNNITGDRGRSRTPSLTRTKRALQPDKDKDDMHFRRCQQSVKTPPDAQKPLQMTGSYLLVSQAHLATSDTELSRNKDAQSRNEPDIVFDDVSLRNIKRANSVKVIDPQPPFGIPIGPTTQASPNDYLHLQPKDMIKSNSLPRKEADPAMDDLAFRNLRRDRRERSVNTSELDEILSEANDSPLLERRNLRSQSADRARGLHNNFDVNSGCSDRRDRFCRTQTPRRVKHQDEAKRVGRFFESYRDAVNDGEPGLSSISNRNNPSWLERANLNDPEITCGISSIKAVSQPDIRNAIIRESSTPTGGPDEFDVANVVNVEVPSTNLISCQYGSSTGDLTAPRLVKIQSLSHASSSQGLIAKTLYKPLDSIFNNKPKPFYLADSKPEVSKPSSVPILPSSVTTTTAPVNIAQLESLISTLSKIDDDGPEKQSPMVPLLPSYTRVYAPTTRIKVNSDSNKNNANNKISTSDKVSEKHITHKLPSPEQNPPSTPETQKIPDENGKSINESEQTLSTFQKYEVSSAKHSIMNAIRLSMALGSASSEVNESEQSIQGKNR